MQDVLAAAGNDNENTGPKRVYCLDGKNGDSVWTCALDGPVFSVIGIEDFTGDGKPDVLAISVGNIHRLENDFVDINFDHFKILEQAINIPLVIHGTSGIKPADIRRLAASRVCKFNIGTCLRQRFGHALRQTLNSDPNLFDRLSIMKQVIPEVSDEASKMIQLLGQ